MTTQSNPSAWQPGVTGGGTLPSGPGGVPPHPVATATDHRPARRP